MEMHFTGILITIILEDYKPFPAALKMAKYYVAFSRSLSTQYKAGWHSNVTVFLTLILFISFILPLILSYNTDGFWIKHYSYREQPRFKFKYEYLLVLENQDLTVAPIICTTNREIDPNFHFSDNCSLMKVTEIDKDDDGKDDEMSLSLFITNTTKNLITALHLFLVFDYKIYNECTFEMEVLTLTSLAFSRPTGQVNLIGEFDTSTNNPFPCNKRQEEQNQTSVLLSFSPTKGKFNRFFNIMSSYSSKSTKVNLKNVFFTTKHKQEIAENEPFVITTKLQYNEQVITYKAKFWQLIKWAWIQYFSIMAFFIFICKKLKKFVFQNRILYTIKTNHWEK